MNIHFDVTRTYRIDGKDYNSIEDMPDDVREAFRKAMTSHSGSVRQVNPKEVQTKVIFNGTEYEGVSAMPAGLRQLCENVLEAANTDTPLRNTDLTGITGNTTGGPTPMRDGPHPAIAEASFSMGKLMMSLGGAVLILVLCYLFFAH